MKKFVLLFAALLVTSCGEKSSPEGSESASEKPTPPSEDVKPSADSPEPLISDADVERFAKDAMDIEAARPPADYNGWTKIVSGGRLRELMQWKNGKPDGPSAMWHENGQKSLETTNKDGKQDVLETEWHENGQKKSEETWKDGKADGPATMWHENGRKQAEGAAKDGKPDGLWTMWHENGQKQAEATFKDGEQVSGKYWNSKGKEVETREEAFE